MNGDTNPSDSDQGDQPADEPKIIVDSDWKEQVARERDQPEESPADVSIDSEPAADDSANPPAPPASFEVLITMLFTQAMTLLGQIPDPGSSEVSVNKPYAKHYIDTLEMLDGKTQGNLSDAESTMLSEALHALRLTYVNVKP
jgi:hypothetical protein